MSWNIEEMLNPLKSKNNDLSMSQMVPYNWEEAWLNSLLFTFGFHLAKVTQF
jgi:hypothetical protein